MSIFDEIRRIRRIASMEIFELLCNHDNEKLPIEFNAIGIAFYSMIGTKNPDEILSILRFLNLSQEGAELAYNHWQNESFGQYDVVVKFRNNEIEDKDIFKYLLIDNSKMGVWNAYLLYALWHTLPLYDHSGYNYRNYIFSKKEIDTLYIDDKSIKAKCLNSNIDIIIVGAGEYFYISCCYWSPFSGLSRVICEIQIRNNKIINIEEIKFIDLVKYGRELRL